MATHWKEKFKIWRILLLLFSHFWRLIETLQNHFTYEFWFFSSPVKKKKAIEYVTKSSALASLLRSCFFFFFFLALSVQKAPESVLWSFFFFNAILFLSALLPFALCRFEGIGRNQSLTFVEELAVLGFWAQQDVEWPHSEEYDTWGACFFPTCITTTTTTVLVSTWVELEPRWLPLPCTTACFFRSSIAYYPSPMPYEPAS